MLPLLLAGVVLAHISVNLFNEYSDYKTGIDFNTHRSPFSGGSGMIVSGKTKSPDCAAGSHLVPLHWLL
jgi:1,4-dihydroxy-2-naphthoate octaprenyltransferase